MLENTVYKLTFTADGATAQFDFTDFAIYDETHLAVYIDEVKQTSGYTVNLTDSTFPKRGNVVFDTEPEEGSMVVLKPEPPLTQTLNFINNESTPALLQNRSLDLIVQTLQDFSEQLGRCVKSGINTDEPGDVIDWTTVIGSGSITAAMLNTDVTTLINSLIAAGTSSFQTASQVNALIAAGITGKASSGANSDITVLSALTSIFIYNGVNLTGSLTTDLGTQYLTAATGKNLILLGGGTLAQITLSSAGAIVCTPAAGQTGTYNTSSDERLKTNIEDFDALEVLCQVLPKKYERVGKAGVKEYGFMAQKLVTVLPQAVTVGDDAKGTPWGVDYSKTTPVLWKAIVQLIARIEAIEKALKIKEK
jgi:hypothetical protein